MGHPVTQRPVLGHPSLVVVAMSPSPVAVSYRLAFFFAVLLPSLWVDSVKADEKTCVLSVVFSDAQRSSSPYARLRYDAGS